MNKTIKRKSKLLAIITSTLLAFGLMLGILMPGVVSAEETSAMPDTSTYVETESDAIIYDNDEKIINNRTAIPLTSIFNGKVWRFYILDEYLVDYTPTFNTTSDLAQMGSSSAYPSDDGVNFDLQITLDGGYSETAIPTGSASFFNRDEGYIDIIFGTEDSRLVGSFTNPDYDYGTIATAPTIVPLTEMYLQLSNGGDMGMYSAVYALEAPAADDNQGGSTSGGSSIGGNGSTTGGNTVKAEGMSTLETIALVLIAAAEMLLSGLYIAKVPNSKAKWIAFAILFAGAVIIEGWLYLTFAGII